MPTIMPPVVPMNMGIANARTWAERRIAQIVGPIPTGQTIWKAGDDWFCESSPSQAVLDTASTVLLGGHVYELEQELIDEIETALDVTLPVVT